MTGPYRVPEKTVRNETGTQSSTQTGKSSIQVNSLPPAVLTRLCLVMTANVVSVTTAMIVSMTLKVYFVTVSSRSRYAMNLNVMNSRFSMTWTMFSIANGYSSRAKLMDEKLCLCMVCPTSVTLQHWNIRRNFPS